MKTAKLYRMVTDKHICPFGIKSKDLLQRKGYHVEDNHLTTREQTDAFKKEHQVETTPQTFIDDQRIGGYDALRSHFNMPPAKPESTTYTPVIAVFAMCFLMALSTLNLMNYPLFSFKLLEMFIAFSMCVLAILKLRDLYAFTNQFITYDLVGRRYVRYAYFYPFAEGLAGLLMIAGVGIGLAAPLAFTIGTIGALSVIKAVYIDKRELKCACVGGNSNVPLGAISLTENFMMMLIAAIMLIR